MKLSGWIWLIAGIIISAISGYVYLAIPKNGRPNTAMAFFFFIGIVFILVGIARLFFRRYDDKKSIVDSIEKPQTSTEKMYVQDIPEISNKPNRVEQAVQKLSTQSTSQTQNQHSNTYAHIHQYDGPVHAQQSIHANNPSVTPQKQQLHAQQNQAAHHVQNTTEHSIKCRRCGNVNTGSANYCHQCGNRLK